MTKTGLSALAVCAAVVSGACTVKQTEPPGLSGPSTFALALRVTATPDRLTQDGASQAAILVQAIGPDGRALSGVSLRMDMVVQGTVVDYGALSARTIVTGNDGTARTTYTAPPAPPPPNNTSINTVSVRALPVGNDASTANESSVQIRLMPSGVILPPAETPTAQFTVTPTPVNMNTASTFDATNSCGGPLSNGACTSGSQISNYSWTFGDGGTGFGRTVQHTFTAPGSFSVTLTVTNDRGVAASTTQTIAVGTSAAPAGDWVFSPTVPVVGDTVIFNADGVKATPGHTITSYAWNFGDNSADGTASGMLVTHVFTKPNSYAIVLTVTDDTGQKTTLPKTITIGNGNPTVRFTFAVTNAGSHIVSFDASGTTASGSATIQSYSWSFGDGGSDTKGPTTSHQYSAGGSFTVLLTVTDSLGRIGTTSVSVTVP